MQIIKKIGQASIKIAIIQVITLFLFGLGYALIKTEGSENVLGVLILFVGFHSIVNACDLGFATSVARGDDFTWMDIGAIAAYGLILSFFAGNIFAILSKHTYHTYISPLVTVFLFYTVFMNGIFKGFLDRKRAFAISTLINTSLIALSTNLYVAGLDYNDANQIFISLSVMSTGFLLTSILVLNLFYRFDLIGKGSSKNTLRKLKKTIKISVINVQGNLYGRADRFIYPYIWGAPVPNEFMILSEAAQRLLIFTASISRAAIPYLGDGEIKFQKLNLKIETKILLVATLFTIVALFVVSETMTTNVYLDNAGIILILSISTGFIVLSQYYFTGFLISSGYEIIIKSQIYSLVVYVLSILLYASNAEMLSLALLLKTISEYLVFKKNGNVRV